MTIPALASLFTGPLAPFADRLTLTDVAGSRTGAELLAGMTLPDLFARLAMRYGGGDRRAVASIWSKHHFSTLIAPVLAANLLLDLDLPVGLETIRVVFDEEGRTRKLVLPHGGHPVAAGIGSRRFDGLIEGHLEPLVAALAAASGASKRVFWSNAGNVFDFVVRGAAEMGAADRPGPAAGLRLMAERRRDGRPNPFYEPVSYGEGDGKRLRRTCCIRYLIPRVGYCGTCPIIPDGEAKTEAE